MSAHWHEEARELRAAGEKISEIADRYGRTRQRIQQITKGVVCPINHRAVSSPKNLVKARAAKRFVSMWTPDADAFLMANYGALTAAQIANKLGCTRNCVIGRAWRTGLSQKVRP